MTVARCLRCLKDFENDCVGSCLEFSTPVFLFLRWLAFGVAAGCLLLSKLWKSYRKVSQSNTKNAAHWHRTAAILYDILKKKEGVALERVLENWHPMVMPEAVLFKIRAEVFSRSEHLLTAHKVLSSGVHRNCLQSLSEKWSVLPGIGTVGRGEGFREDFCVLLDVTQQGLPNHTKMQRKDSCKFLCGCMFRTVTKNSRGLFPQLSRSHVEVGLLAVKYGTTWI